MKLHYFFEDRTHITPTNVPIASGLLLAQFGSQVCSSKAMGMGGAVQCALIALFKFYRAPVYCAQYSRLRIAKSRHVAVIIFFLFCAINYFIFGEVLVIVVPTPLIFFYVIY